MRTGLGTIVALWCAAMAAAQTPAPVRTPVSSEPVVVSTEHPRLLLRPARLRLLRRERERTSMRWQQFFTLMAGHAPMPEPGLAQALYYQVAEDADAGRAAIAWALGADADLRQQALVFDWCQDLLSEAQKRDLAARMVKGMTQTASDESVPAVRSRVLAAVALFDHVADVPRRELERAVHGWWGGRTAPALTAGREIVPRDEAYDLYELLHVIRDNTNLDLRESARAFFKDYPIAHLLSYYPAVFPAPENDYYIGAEPHIGEPDLRLAAISRAADMAMVAFDTNALESQMLQGWLMHDRFLMRSTFAAPYEFLWANPYQPGLSYYHAPLAWHGAGSSVLFARASWEDSAAWFGLFHGVMQVFEDGHVSAVDAARAPGPVLLGPAAVCFARTSRKFRVTVDPGGAVYLVGLVPGHTYEVEVDDEEMYEADSDRAGILAVEVPAGKEVGLRIKEQGLRP
ncbi:MAG: hypothetical protein ABSF62_22405 [Bryobacteraceae bacterium]